MIIDTEEAQNTIARVRDSLFLRIDKPTPKIRKQYSRVKKALIDLSLELEILNEMKINP